MAGRAKPRQVPPSQAQPNPATRPQHEPSPARPAGPSEAKPHGRATQARQGERGPARPRPGVSSCRAVPCGRVTQGRQGEPGRAMTEKRSPVVPSHEAGHVRNGKERQGTCSPSHHLAYALSEQYNTMHSMSNLVGSA